MKTTFFRFLWLVLVMLFVSFATVPTVFAQPPGQTADSGAASSSTAADSGAPGGRVESIQSTFDVNKLKLPGQREPVPASGTGGQGQQTEQQQRPPGAIGFVVYFIDLLVKIIGSLALVVFVIGAVLVIASQGKEDMLERGKTAMIYAIIGLVVTFFSFIIVTFVQSILFK